MAFGVARRAALAGNCVLTASVIAGDNVLPIRDAQMQSAYFTSWSAAQRKSSSRYVLYASCVVTDMVYRPGLVSDICAWRLPTTVRRR